MYYKITNNMDLYCLSHSIKKIEAKYSVDEVEMFNNIVEVVKENIEILCSNYGEGRNADRDLGGYVLLFLSSEDKDLLVELLMSYSVGIDDFEYDSVIVENNYVQWRVSCYVLSSDYGIIIVRPIAEIPYRIEI